MTVRKLLLAGMIAVLALGTSSPATVPGSPTASAKAPSARTPSAKTPWVTETRRPNIVVVMADDMRFDDMRFAPRLRRLARTAVTFENAFSSFPLCCPARASFLTGQLPHNHGVIWHERPRGYRVFDDSRTLATAFAEVGYRSGFVGKYLNRYGLDRSLVSGIPSYSYVPNGWTDWYAAFQSQGVAGVRGGTFDYYATPFNINGSWKNHVGRYQTNVIGRYTRRLVATYDRGRAPFFLYVNYLAPHDGSPAEADDPRGVHDRAGRPVQVRTPARPEWVKGHFDGVIDRAAGRPRGGGPAERDVSDKPPYLRKQLELSRQEWEGGKELTRQRAEAILVMDRDIGRTVRTLKRLGEWDETIFVFTSDNGYLLGEHRMFQRKVRGHEPSLRVPLLVTGPGLRDGSRRYDPMTTVDLTATLLDLAGAAPPRPADGVSLADVLHTGDQGWTRAVPVESAFGVPELGSVFGPGDRRRSVGVRTSRYSYTVYSSGAQELYDLARDPHQLESVARNRSYARARRALRGVLERIEDCRGDECHVPLPDRLIATPAENEQVTRQWLADHRSRYGWW